MPTATKSVNSPSISADVPVRFAAAIDCGIIGSNDTATVMPIITPTNPTTNSRISPAISYHHKHYARTTKIPLYNIFIYAQNNRISMWSIAKLSDRNIDLLVEIEKKKKITAQEQTIYTPFAFYLNIGFLSKYGIVASNGFSENNRKEWELTSKGKEVLKHLKKAEQIMAS